MTRCGQGSSSAHRTGAAAEHPGRPLPASAWVSAPPGGLPASVCPAATTRGRGREAAGQLRPGGLRGSTRIQEWGSCWVAPRGGRLSVQLRLPCKLHHCKKPAGAIQRCRGLPHAARHGAALTLGRRPPLLPLQRLLLPARLLLLARHRHLRQPSPSSASSSPHAQPASGRPSGRRAGSSSRVSVAGGSLEQQSRRRAPTCLASGASCASLSSTGVAS